MSTEAKNNLDPKRAEKAKTIIVKAIFPGSTNHYQTLFGGTALQWMDEVAFITATRYSRKKMVTISSDKIDFKNPIPTGSIVELVGTVTHVGGSSMIVDVDVYREEMYSEERELAIHSKFTMVAINENRKPIKIHD